MKKVKLIYNPRAGKKELLQEFDTVFNLYQKAGYILTIFRICKSSTLSDALIDIDESYSHILIAGGDGTINNVVNAIKEKEIDIPIAILPVGTANDFARSLGMPEDIEASVKQILASEIKQIDLGKANDRYFVNILSTGVFTDISQKVDKNLKKSLGRLAYYLTSIKEISNIKSLDIMVESKEVYNREDKYLMFVFNGRTAGRIPFAYKAELDDGVFDVIILKAKGIPKSINIFFKILNGTYLEDEEVIEYFKTDKLLIDSKEDIVVDLDGERGPHFPIEITCIKGGLKVYGYLEKESYE